MAVERKIHYEYSSEMLMKYWKDYFLKKYGKDFIINAVIIIVALLIYFFSEYVYLAALIIGFCLLYLGFTYYFYYLAAINRIKKKSREYNNSSIVLSEEGVEYGGDLWRTAVKWDAFTKFTKCRECWLLIDKNELHLPIPIEVFDQECDRAWIESKLIEKGIKEVRL